MKKMELKSYRDKMIVNHYQCGLTLEEVAYVYNLSAQRIQEILKSAGITAKANSKAVKELKAPKSKKK